MARRKRTKKARAKKPTAAQRRAIKKGNCKKMPNGVFACLDPKTDRRIFVSKAQRATVKRGR